MNNQDLFKSQWNQLRSVIQENFDALTPDDISQINGKREVLISKIQSRYGISKDVAEEQLSEIEATTLNGASRGLRDTGATKGKIPGAQPRTGGPATSGYPGKTGTPSGKQVSKDPKFTRHNER